MDLHYSAGTIKALEKVGLDLNPEAIKQFIRNRPGAVVGGAIGGGLAFNTLTSKKEPHPRMRRPEIENNPLLYGLQY